MRYSKRFATYAAGRFISSASQTPSPRLFRAVGELPSEWAPGWKLGRSCIAATCLRSNRTAASNRLAVGFRVVHVDRRPVTLNLFVLGSATEGHKMDSLLKAHPSSGTTEQKNLTPIRSLPVIFNDGLVGLRR